MSFIPLEDAIQAVITELCLRDRTEAEKEARRWLKIVRTHNWDVAEHQAALTKVADEAASAWGDLSDEHTDGLWRYVGEEPVYRADDGSGVPHTRPNIEDGPRQRSNVRTSLAARVAPAGPPQPFAEDRPGV